MTSTEHAQFCKLPFPTFEELMAASFSHDEIREVARFLALFSTGHYKTEKEIKMIGMDRVTAQKLVFVIQENAKNRKREAEESA